MLTPSLTRLVAKFFSFLISLIPPFPKRKFKDERYNPYMVYRKLVWLLWNCFANIIIICYIIIFFNAHYLACSDILIEIHLGIGISLLVEISTSLSTTGLNKMSLICKICIIYKFLFLIS